MSIKAINDKVNELITLQLATKTPKEREDIRDTGNFLMGIAMASAIIFLCIALIFVAIEIDNQEVHITPKGSKCVQYNDTFIYPYMLNYTVQVNRSDINGRRYEVPN